LQSIRREKLQEQREDLEETSKDGFITGGGIVSIEDRALRPKAALWRLELKFHMPGRTRTDDSDWDAPLEDPIELSLNMIPALGTGMHLQSFV
jgi:hypothetical protein